MRGGYNNTEKKKEIAYILINKLIIHEKETSLTLISITREKPKHKNTDKPRKKK